MNKFIVNLLILLTCFAANAHAQSSIDNQISDLNFDLGDKRKIQLPNGQWLVKDNFEFSNAGTNYNSIVLKSKNGEDYPILYFTKSLIKSSNWSSDPCTFFDEQNNPAFYNGPQKSIFKPNFVKCGGFEYFNNTQEMQRKLKFLGNQRKFYNNSMPNNNIIVHKFILNKLYDYRIQALVFEEIQNFQFSNEGEFKNSNFYKLATAWNIEYLKKIEDTFYENKKVASFDLLSKLNRPESEKKENSEQSTNQIKQAENKTLFNNEKILTSNLNLTIQSDKEKTNSIEVNSTKDKQFVDLSFDLGDGRRIQLPNGKWSIFKEYERGTNEVYKSIILKSELPDTPPSFISIYLSNKKQTQWNGGCSILQTSKPLYFSGIQNNKIQNNTINCGSYDYYDTQEAALKANVITRDEVLGSALKTILKNQPIIIHRFIIEKSGDNKIIMAIIEPSNFINNKFKNSKEYIEISKWNALFLMQSENIFYENKQVTSLDLISRSTFTHNTQLASSIINVSGEKDEKSKEQVRLAQETKVKEEERLLAAQTAREQLKLVEEAKFKEQQRLALEAQQKEQSRLAQETKVKEQERLLAEQKTKEQLKLVEEAKFKEQQQLALEAQQKEQSRLAQETKVKEQERLLAEQKTKEQLRVAEETAKAKDLELAKLKEELASIKLRNEKNSITSSARKALVIGNDNYISVSKLSNAREDANAVGRTLSDLGYKVTVKNDLTEKEMKVTLRQFKNDLEGGDEVVIFYAGHGVQIGSTNYLLPTDIKGESEDQVRDDAIQLQRLLDDMNEKKVKLTLAMIDACRDNPFPKSGRAIGSRGLAPTTAATGQMIIFSAGSGQQALDKLGPTDKNPNGLFTRMLLSEMKTPGIRIDNMIREVRRKVVNAAKSVGHEQVPAIYDQVVGDFYFNN